MQLKRIAISGLGGVGGYYGAMLSLEAEREGLGREVYFIARGEHLDAIRAQGLHVITPSRDFMAHPYRAIAVTDTDLPQMDLIIIATKSYDLVSNIQELKPLIGTHTIILPLLNGYDISQQIRALLPETQVWEGCTYISARKAGAGLIRLENDRELFLFGSLEPERTAQECELQDLLTRASITAHNPEDISAHIRKKYLMISATATGTSYYDAPIGICMQEHPEQMQGLLRELITLYRAMGHQIEEGLLEHAMERQLIMPRESTSSMHADFRLGGRTELEGLTGFVVREASRLGVDLPLYRMMYDALAKRTRD